MTGKPNLPHESSEPAAVTRNDPSDDSDNRQIVPVGRLFQPLRAGA